MKPTLSELHLYPVKSCAPLPSASATVEKRGLIHDRRWMIVDADGKFVTGRQHARLPLLQAEPVAGGLRMSAPGMPPVTVAEPADGARCAVNVWRDSIDAVAADSTASEWVSRFLGQPARLVFMDAAARRPVDPTYAQAEDEVSFADGFPVLLISQAALDHLNARLATPISILRFRPNLVVDGTAPHAEDQWRRVRIGEVEFDVVKPCTRCVFTTVDPARGERDPSGEPLRTLTTYRRSPSGVTFGQNLIPRGSGVIHRGDAVHVLD
ncbi:MOSC domain-containing protein [Tahibacter amnicola]|uniref:MOSC domain-containing protein n=1 Tax=Tahibacter amnicola TaxID=2976241 RepID=A0ABY6BJY5_9GAMM|nr:MOSC domain-containing protein [Tahibacter amnicola]UXI69395.1 MOSC domain-containing protein [Tahibacter amnicola]